MTAIAFLFDLITLDADALNVEIAVTRNEGGFGIIARQGRRDAEHRKRNDREDHCDDEPEGFALERIEGDLQTPGEGQPALLEGEFATFVFFGADALGVVSLKVPFLPETSIFASALTLVLIASSLLTSIS